MTKKSVLALLAAVIICSTLTVSGQDAISAKSGMVNYFEGKVLLSGEALAYDRATFHRIPPGGTLEATAQGRAEVLLSPGVMMWVGEGAKIELISDSLVNAQVRVLAGSVVISGVEFPDEMSLTVLVNEDTVDIRKSGIYRFDAAPASLYVYEGEAKVLRASEEIKVKKGRTLALSQSEAEIAKFDKDEVSGLMNWAQTRDNYVQTANLSAARSMTQGGFPTLSMSALSGFGYWVYNPFFGMYSFVPMGSAYLSPFGYYYYTPQSIRNAYASYYYGGYSNPRQRSRPISSDPSFSRGGFGESRGGLEGYTRGASSMGSGGFSTGRAAGGTSGGFSRGSSSIGAGAGAGRGSVPMSSGGASMGRGASSSGRGGGGGRNH